MPIKTAKKILALSIVISKTQNEVNIREESKKLGCLVSQRDVVYLG
jgi:hypothetical protein